MEIPLLDLKAQYQTIKKEWIWINVISNPVFEEDGSFNYFNGIILDITPTGPDPGPPPPCGVAKVL